MKKALIIFAIVFALLLAIPMLSLIDKKEATSNNELVTIFNDSANLEAQYRSPFLSQN